MKYYRISYGNNGDYHILYSKAKALAMARLVNESDGVIVDVTECVDIYRVPKEDET